MNTNDIIINLSPTMTQQTTFTISDVVSVMGTNVNTLAISLLVVYTILQAIIINGVKQGELDNKGFLWLSDFFNGIFVATSVMIVLTAFIIWLKI